MRRFTAPADAQWCLEMADPDAGGPTDVLCHNDVCPENVVYRGGMAHALLDFDFAAPGRRIWDLGALASMCVPVVQPEAMAVTGRRGLDPFHRLRVVADAYGLEDQPGELVAVLAQRIAGPNLVRRRAAGEPAFVAMWNAMGGEAYVTRRIAWFHNNRQRLLEALS